jgi:hypothetical protein
MDKYQQAIFNAVKILINAQSFSFNYCLEGKITAVNTSDYTVLINEESYNLKSLLGTSFLVNDLVFILVINGDSSKKYILCKRP